ncbi:hypothetical protein [Mammaliicoccus vitulinus]|uniref:hypothetical protein n=1 Tax=Mammaliicoccus vitulinus TaxID=71237 RepID=UPI0028D3087A|nr:hypothetical protein [Mammaliicoccus vitulinus]
MEFKAGDRVHVKRLSGFDTDFYATLSNIGADICQLKCSTGGFENIWIFLPSHHSFGPDKKDYYTLATDEEDTEEPVIQRVENINKAIEESDKYIEQAKHDHKIKLDNNYIIEVKKGLYVALVASNGYLKLTNDINEADEYEFENAAMKHADLVDGRILNLKRYVEV